MKEYTGHKNPKMKDGKTIVEWLRMTVDDECKFYGVPKLTDEQIAVVASAMRMHHLITYAATYDTSELADRDKVTEFWPIESSIGRFFRDASRITLDAWRLKQRD